MNSTAKICSLIDSSGLFRAGDRVLVALSGGADSMALLELMRRSSLNLCITAVHYNHGLRGDAADEDERFCREAAARLGVSYLTATAWRLKEHRGSLQQVARTARYGFFENVAKHCGASSIATAHHADDQAETLLLQLFSGAGPAAMAGIPEVRGLYRRPLLKIPSAVLRECLQEMQVTWREDQSNTSFEYRRNWVRHSLLPRLELRFSGVRRALLQYAEIAADENKYWSSVYSDAVAVSRISGRSVRLQLAFLRTLPRSGVLRMLRLALEELDPELALPGRYLFAHVDGWLQHPSEGPRCWFRAGAVSAVEYRDGLHLQLDGNGEDERIAVSGPGLYPIHGGAIFIEELQLDDCHGACLPREAAAEGVVYIRPPEQLILRGRLAGDRIREAQGRKQLKDLYRELKLDHEERKRAVVAEDSGAVVFVLFPDRPGSHRVAIESMLSEPGRAWRISWQRGDVSDKKFLL